MGEPPHGRRGGSADLSRQEHAGFLSTEDLGSGTPFAWSSATKTKGEKAVPIAQPWQAAHGMANLSYSLGTNK